MYEIWLDLCASLYTLHLLLNKLYPWTRYVFESCDSNTLSYITGI